MVIEIIDPGRDPRDKYEGKCFDCGCKFTCTEDDIDESLSLLGGMTYRSVSCPNEFCANDRVEVYQVTEKEQGNE